MSSSARPAYATLIRQRPPLGIRQWFAATSFNLVFDLTMLCIHAVQIAALPLSLHSITYSHFRAVTNWSKGAYGQLLVFIAEIWAPTILRVSVDSDVDGFLDLNKIVTRDSRGIVVGLDLPERMVLMANHQVGMRDRGLTHSLTTAHRSIVTGAIFGKYYSIYCAREGC